MEDDKNNNGNKKEKEKKKRFQTEGDDAAYLFRGFHEKTVDPHDPKLFIKEHKDWVLRYGERNVKHNFERTRDRYAAWSRTWEGESQKFLNRCGITAPATADDLDPEFVKNREYFPPSGGGAPPPVDPKEKEEKRNENQKLTQQLIHDSGINIPPTHPPKKKVKVDPTIDKIPEGDKKLPAKKSLPKGSGEKTKEPKAFPSPSETNKKKMGDEQLINAVEEMMLDSPRATESKMLARGFRARVVPMKKVFTDPVYSNAQKVVTRSGVLIIVHLPSGCDGNDVHFDIIEGGRKVAIEVTYPEAYHNAASTLGPNLAISQPAILNILSDALNNERDEMIKTNGDTTLVEREILDMPFAIEPGFRSLRNFNLEPDPEEIILTDYGAQLVLTFAFKMQKFGSPNAKNKKTRKITGPGAPSAKLQIPGIAQYMQPQNVFPSQQHQQPYQQFMPPQQQAYPPSYFHHQIHGAPFPMNLYQCQMNPNVPPPQPQQSFAPHVLQHNNNFMCHPQALTNPYADLSQPEAMSVASSTVASKKSCFSQSLKANTAVTKHPTKGTRHHNGFMATSEAIPGGNTSPRVRNRPPSTEPPPGRVDVLRQRNNYNQQASSLRSGITVETVKDKSGSGTSSYEEFTVSENDQTDEQWHSPTNITPDEEYQESDDDDSETDND